MSWMPNPPPILNMIVALLVLLGVVVLAYAAATETPLRYGDERQYVEIAHSISEGQGYVLSGSPTAYRPPAWPVIIAVFLLLGMPHNLLALIPALLLVIASFVAVAIGVRLTRSPWGGLAGVAVLTYPLNVYTATTLYPQAFATLLVLSLWLICLVVSERSDKRPAYLYILAGLLASLLILSVPTLGLTALVVAGWLVVTAHGERLRAGLYVLVSFILPILSWTIRNMVIMGSPILVSTSGGINLLIGNNPSATASSGVNVDIDGVKASAHAMGEVDADKYFRDSALDWIAHNPGDSFTLYLAKAANYFSPYNEPVTAVQGTGVQRLIAYASFGVLILLVIIRLLLRARSPLQQTERLFLWLFFANSFAMAIFFTRTRFRQPLDSILLVEASLACVLLVGMLIRVYRARRGLH